jgi:chromate transporter
MSRRPRWFEVLVVSLRLGLTSFGGPIAHVGYQRTAFVVRDRWLDEAAFAELVALCQALPGPASTQLMIAVGRLRGGWAGALAAFVGFTLPSVVLMTMLGLAAAGATIPTEGAVAGAVAGLKAAAVAVVAQAVVAMARRLTPDAPRIALAVGAGILALAVPMAVVQPLLIVGGALVGWLGLRRLGAVDLVAPVATPAAAPATGTSPRLAAPDLEFPGGRRIAVALAVAWVALLVGGEVAARVTGQPGLGFVAALIRAGALVFGGGHVVLPLLDAGVVTPGWVTPDAFLAGYGAAQAVPGPLFSFAAYLGVVSSSGPGGVPGAFLATVAIFLPGALLVLAALPVLRRLRARPGVAAALAGTNAVVVGILAAALITPVGTGGLTSIPAVVVAATGAAGLLTGRVPPLVVVAASAGVMALVEAATVGAA